MQFALAGLSYFALVFAAGFGLGVVRTLWAEPRVGAQMAELAEMPLMLAVIVYSASWVARRQAVPGTTLQRLGMGLVGLSLVLLAESAVVIGLRDLTIGEYLASRDPVSLSVYGLLLLVFAVMPLLVERRGDLRHSQRRVASADAGNPDSQG